MVDIRVIPPRALRSLTGMHRVPDITLEVGETHDMSQYVGDGVVIDTSQILNLNPAVATYDNATKLLTGVTAGLLSGLQYEVTTTTAVSDVDITQLTEYTGAVMASADTTAYDALNVGAKAAGDSFNDPVTGVLTTKITSSSAPATDSVTTLYSSMGLAISRAWGVDSDEYTLVFHSWINSAGWNATGYIIDYKLGGTISNLRTIPSGEGRVAFARAVGSEQILYIATGSQLRRYNTATDAYDDTGDFPYTWATNGNATTWLNMNGDDSRAVAMNGSTITSLNLGDGSVITQSPAGLDEPYMGSGVVAYLNVGTDRHWNLATDTLSNLTNPSGWSTLSHSAALDGFLFHFDVDGGGGQWRSTKILDNNTFTTTQTINGYWSDTHSSGHWWDVPVGTDPHSLMSHDRALTSPNTESWKMSLVLVNCNDAGKRLLGHHYSFYGSGIIGTYYDETHATIANDGKLVMYTSNMNNTVRHDVFVMELPRTA